ncbi:MAG TPA: chromate efflux transporter, partial [Vicinamibacteria bacterium]|nr:chromate efflux transporter [Vicinamibacteria bacterium]
SGLLAVLLRARPAMATHGAMGLAVAPSVLASALAGPASAGILWRIGWFFAEAGSFVFGSGLAIVPFLHGGVVKDFGWLSERQFLDAVAVAMITPGPVVITVAFIGFLAAGPAGAVVAAAATFLPCYLLTVLPAPHFRRWSQARGVRAFVDGVTAAATGAIAGAALVLGRRAIVDAGAAVLALATLAVAWRFPKVPEPLLVLAAGIAGVLRGGLVPMGLR